MKVIEYSIPIVAILSSVALPIGFGLYLSLVSLKAKHKEKMESLKLGIPYTETHRNNPPNKYTSLRNGILCVGISIGAILGMVTIKLADMSEAWNTLVLISSIILFLGISYISYFAIMESKKNKEEDINE